MLVGGKDGEQFTVSSAMALPPGIGGDEKSAMDSITKTWRGGPWTTYNQSFFIEGDMAAEGEISFRFLMDGLPLAELPLPML